ncbi:MAG: OmpA family protein [Flavobacterium sp.]|uniref:OmpA family protein n=1 Tax=Flavobacterium sp. TaxID=239 RepID=UPI002620830A|nr:OmpA family protein [Flavobacterium sp.]MDD5150917.1 OmpA family protein [Flavobacterium sp.]
MKIKNIFYSTLLSVFVFQGFSQKAKVAAADKQYDNYAYVDAIATYERVAQKGYKDEKMFQKLGNAYYFNAELEKAAKWYGELFAMNQEQEPEYYYRYAQSLKATGDYVKADKMLQQFNKKSGNDLRAKLIEKNKNYLEEIKANSGRYTIADAGINSEYSDYGGSFLGNKLVFASARDTGSISKIVFAWTNQSFTNFYSSELKEDGSLSKPKHFGNKINSKFHEATPVFTKDGKTMYFTRNNFLDGKKGVDGQQITLLKIYKATYVDSTWVNVTELPFSSDQYSTAHPALSKDEKTLYFASDMPGTLGQSDLFKVAINEDGSFGTPENLGATINTEGRETFPFISDDNELYFASDGRPGLGGLDIFVSNAEKDGSFKEIQNIGAPVNGPHDDFAFIIDKNRKGFFTSNRPGGIGYDDIYKFTEIKKLVCEQFLSGIITDQETSAKLAGVKAGLFDDKFQFLKECLSDENGKYSFEVECGKNYYVRAEKEDYQTKEVKVTIDNAKGKTDMPVSIEKNIKPIEVGTDLAKTVNIPNIYFDVDKFIIREDAALELGKIVAVMNQYPAMKVDVRSHTDSRSSAKYNEELSNSRAKATMEWLVQNGIESSRLTSKGYGESQLINKCSDGVKCTEAEHQANRRSEFIVISME